MAAEDTRAALHGLRVLDLSRVLAGPWCGQLLGDLGADVVKVERPGSGDDTRHWGPPWLPEAPAAQQREATYFLSANRNKRSLAVDLGQPAGQSLVRELAARADVLLENFKTGGLTRYGLDYPSLAAVNPRLIYCSITGFGQSGPYARRPGYDFLVQAMGGLMSVTGRPDGEPGGGPMKVGVALTDVTTGLYAAVAVLAALQRRHATGRGQHIDLALLDVQVAALANQAAGYLAAGALPQRMGNAHPSIVPYQDFPSADGHIIITVGNDTQFAALCGVLGRPEWASDPRFASNPQRVRNRELLVPWIAELTARRPTRHWVDALQAAGVPGGPINTLEGVFADPQVMARGMRVDMPRGEGPALALVANPIRLSESPVSYRAPPPQLGQHGREVLQDWLALDEQAIEQLRRQQVI